MNFWTGILGFLAQVLSGSTGKIVESIEDIALETVTALNSPFNALTGSQKKEEAYDKILARAQSEGIKVATHAINLAIELAVASLHN